MIDRAIIMLTDRRFWGRASGPSSSGKTLHYWYAHAARRSALPRERFSPLGVKQTSRLRLREVLIDVRLRRRPPCEVALRLRTCLYGQ
jgi:hypothetical protein